MFIAKAMKSLQLSDVWQRKTLLEDAEHEINKPYHAPRKNSSSKYQKRSFYKIKGQYAHFIYPFACRVCGWLSCGIIWHWWWVNYRPYLGLFIADGRRT